MTAAPSADRFIYEERKRFKGAQRPEVKLYYHGIGQTETLQSKRPTVCFVFAGCDLLYFYHFLQKRADRRQVKKKNNIYNFNLR